MADSSRTIMTDAGFALETRVRADETKMQFTRATISTDDHFSDTDDALAKLTELSNIQQDGKVTAVQVINTTTVYVQVDVNQAESKADYQMRSAALYAKDDDGTEVLYGVTVLQDPVFVHKDADGSYLGFGINTTVGRASNVVVVVDPANMVTQQVFESTMKNYYTKAEVDAKFVTDDDFASKLPKNIATTDAANTFAKSQTLAGGATDGKGNAYATTKDVATDLNNGLSTKADTSAVDQLKTNLTNQVSTLQTQVNNSAVGTNLLTGTQDWQGEWGNLPLWPADEEKYEGFAVRKRSVSWGGLGQSYDANPNTTYTFSFYAKASEASNIMEIFTLPTEDYTNPVIGIPVFANQAITTDWQRYSVTFTTKSGGTIYPSVCSNKDSVTIYVAGYKLEKGSVATDWCPNPEDKVNVADMRKPASDVAGIEEVNAKQDKIAYTPADDSKVAHLSGANNFDTTPTVNNNPLLLASSLPSDLARTTAIEKNVSDMNAEVSGGLFFNTNLNALNSPFAGGAYYYQVIVGVWSRIRQIAYSDIFASQIATRISVDGGKTWNAWVSLANTNDVTSAINTATANMVDRNPNTGVVSEPVDFTKLTVNGGKSVATSDDLKSLEASAWRPLTLANSTSGTILFKDNGDGTASLIGSATFTIAKGTKTLTPVITPPTGYTFTSLKWSKGTNNKGVYVTGNMTGVSFGTSYIFDTSLSNGDICFLGSYDDIYTVTFSPSELTTLSDSIECNPALVSISKV